MRLFLCCPFCQSPTNFTKTDNASRVVNGNPVCHRPLCRERFITESEKQTASKAYELGMVWPPPMRRIVHDVGPP